MAKHDQRILKFLNQNADRAPTITEMMTRLNISISDISASLSSLLAQGMIAKKTNNQGIECWFPAGPAPMTAAPAAYASQMSQQQAPQAQSWSSPEVTSGNDSRFITGKTEKVSIPEPMTGKIPVQQVQSTQMAEISNYGGQSSNYGTGSMPTQPAMAMMNLGPQPKSIGLFTFAIGLIAAIAASAFITNRMVTKAVDSASKSFVDQKAMTDVTNQLTEFDNKTKAHVTALEDQVKKLSDQLTGKGGDSVKVADKAPAAPTKAAASAKAVAAKPEPAPAKEKVAKASKKAAATKAPKALPVVAKVSHVKKKKLAHASSKSQNQESAYMDPPSSSSSSESSSSSSSSDASSSSASDGGSSSASAPSDMPPVDDPEKSLPPPSE